MYQKLLKYVYLLGIIVTYILPLVLNKNGGVWVSDTYGDEHRSLEMLGFSASLMWAIGLYWGYRQKFFEHFQNVIWGIAFSMVYFVFLHAIIDHLTPMYDYLLGYEKAAIFLNEGKNPYEGTSYIYPPLFVQLLSSILYISSPQDLFYTYQFIQWLNVLLLFYLLNEAFKGYIPPQTMPFLPLFIAAIMLISTPIYRTLHWQQVNIILLNLMLIGFKYMDKKLIISGLAFAIGIHLKIYPLLFCGLFLMLGRWKLCISIILWVFFIIMLQTHFFQEGTLYKTFLISFQHTLNEIPRADFFRNNSIRSPLVFIFQTLHPFSSTTAQLIINILVNIWRIVMITWITYRCYHRQLIHKQIFMTLNGHLWDCIALMLLISPLLWEHHFVLCLPLILAAFFTSERHLYKIWGVCLILIFVIPTFDIFPFSYHRIIGLIFLVKILPISFPKETIFTQTRDYLVNFLQMLGNK